MAAVHIAVRPSVLDTVKPDSNNNNSKFTYLNTFVILLARRCSDNGGPILYSNRAVTYSNTAVKSRTKTTA